MFNLKIEQDGAVRSFDGLTKREVVEIEGEFIETVFTKGFKQHSLAKVHGKKPAELGQTNTRTSNFSYTVEEDGVLWAAAHFVWPKWSDEKQSMLDGYLSGILGNHHGVKAKEHGKP